MIYIVQCGSCATRFQSERSNAVFCSDACKMRAHRAAKSGKSAPGSPAVTDGPVARATIADLAKVGLEESSVGLSVVALAREVDVSKGSALAAVALRHADLLARVLAQGKPGVDLIDELTFRREERERKAASAG